MGMTKKSANDPRLDRVIKLCMALPEAVCERFGSHATFRVRKKPFAYFLDDHHGDGIVAISCRAAPGVNNLLIADDPKRFYLPSYVGPRGWVALRLDLGPIDWAEVDELIRASYVIAAPTRLAANMLAGDVSRPESDLSQPAEDPVPNQRKRNEKQIERVRRICLALPETTEKLSHGEPTFFAGKKVFAMFSNNHHNDGHVAVVAPAPPGVQAMLVEDSPDKFYKPPYVGGRGWVGMELSHLDDKELAFHLRIAWLLIAPKKFHPLLGENI